MGQVQLPTTTAKVIEKMKTPAKDIGDEVLCLPMGLILLGISFSLFLRGTINIDELWGGYLLASVLISLYFACFLEDQLLSTTPHVRTYGWGFFSGCMALALVPLSLLGILTMLHAGLGGHWEGTGKYVFYCIILVFNGWVGWFVIRRKRWAWIVLTILSCNPILWIANYFYGRKRWNELQ